MKYRLSFVFALMLVATAASAADFGVHGGYYGGDLEEAFVGVDMRFPFGIVAFMPNIDFTRKEDVNFFFGSADLNLQYQTSPNGPSYWFGAGPTLAYARFRGETETEWGWDVNAGLSWSMGGLKPYVTGRYIKLDEGFDTIGASVGLRF